MHSWLKLNIWVIFTPISIVIHGRTSLSRFSTSTSTCPSLFFFSFNLLHCELYSELDNLIAMEILCPSADKGSKDAYDVSVSLTGYEPNFMAFSELKDSSGSFSYMIPSSDQDMDDATLGKLLTEAHRGQADYCDPEGVSVSQSSYIVFDRAGKPDGERNVDQSVGFGVTRNTYSAHSNFSENTQAEKMVDWSRRPYERFASRNSSRIRTLFLKLSGRVQELKNEVSCMNFKRVPGSESVRSGNSHVTSRPESLPLHPIPEWMLRHSFVPPRRKEGPPSIWDTHGISETSLQIHMHLHQLLILKNWINGIRQSRSRSIRLQWRKVKDKNKIGIWDASLDRQANIQSSSVEETFQRSMVQTNNDCRFRIFTLTSSLR